MAAFTTRPVQYQSGRNPSEGRRAQTSSLLVLLVYVLIGVADRFGVTYNAYAPVHTSPSNA